MRLHAWGGFALLLASLGVAAAAVDNGVVYISHQNVDAILRIQDLNDDGDVGIADLAALLAAYGTCLGNPEYDAGADLDGGGCVDPSIRPGGAAGQLWELSLTPEAGRREAPRRSRVVRESAVKRLNAWKREGNAIAARPTEWVVAGMKE